MKSTVKFILSFLCSLVLIPSLLALTVCVTWYVLPEFQSTIVGEWIEKQFPDQTMLIVTIAISCLTLIFFILTKIFNVIKSSKFNNFYTHLMSWLIAIALVGESLFTFFMSNELSITEFDLDLPRKIGIVSSSTGMLLYGLVNYKIKRIIDRKIQAYDTAKELNVKGRSSVIWVHILKAFDFYCPEALLMLALCFSFKIQIALHFIYMIAAFTIPIIGNMVCDFRARKEIVKKEQEKAEAQVNATAEAVADLLAQRGKF